MQYFLHIGLHKTGTKFFQHKVFSNLKKDQIIYNPPKLTQLIADLIKAKECDVDFVLKEIQKEKLNLKNSAKKVLISREVMSGDLFTFYKDCKKHYTRLHKGFFDAKIIMFLRYQTDWIVSCYRETLHEHHYQTIFQFLGLEPGEEKFVKANYKDLNYSEILSQLKRLFGSNNLNILFYENFSKDINKTVNHISKIIGINDVKITKDGNSVPNKGFSALSINISIFRYNLFKAIGIDKFLVHRPIKFFGDGSIPTGFEELSILPKEIYWSNKFLRDNEEVRSKVYPNKLSQVEKIKLKLSWRNFIKKGIDKIVFWDWNILGLKKKLLDNYFKKTNRQLLLDHKEIIIDLPDRYMK